MADWRSRWNFLADHFGAAEDLSPHVTDLFRQLANLPSDQIRAGDTSSLLPTIAELDLFAASWVRGMVMEMRRRSATEWRKREATFLGHVLELLVDRQEELGRDETTLQDFRDRQRAFFEEVEQLQAEGTG